MLSTRAMGGDGFDRSTLEAMLDAIRQGDEQPKDLPPALPARPTSRGRLPTSRRFVSARPNHEASDPGMNDKDVAVSQSGIFGSKKCLGIPELLRYEETVQAANITVFVPCKKLDCGGSDKRTVSECTGLEDDARNQTMQAILWVQKNFRGLQARSHFKQLKAAATHLQSFVRGESERQKFAVLIRRCCSAIVIQKHARRRSATAAFNAQLRDVVLLQSAIRGWLARQGVIVSSAASKGRQTSNLIEGNTRRESTSDHVEVIKDTNNEQSQIYHALAELRSQLLKTEAALQEKEEENAMLKQRLQEYDIRWSNYESKMKSMEATWQGQLNSLQMNFAAARKSHALEEIPKQNRRQETPKPNHYCNFETSSSSEVQPLKDMLSKLQKNSNSVPMRNRDAAPSSVVQLTEEFDRQQRIFDNDAVLVNGAKSEQCAANINHLQELRELKARFASWKKDYKVRLREAKMELLKLGSPEEKVGTRKHWWCTARIK
ncbi:myosin-1-like [Zingiber officinale]|uniref:myosin-1-like n=1 Tax=Zingiber officinale TaxID=94328 RepID=UPI001C4C6E9B|nr:myosin-1-like [Zingiber officinale]